MFTDNDFAELYSDLGLAMTHIAQPSGVQTSVLGMFGAPGKAVLDGDVVVLDPTVRYPVRAWPAVKRGDRVRIGAKTYAVREKPMALNDGSEEIARLEASS